MCLEKESPQRQAGGLKGNLKFTTTIPNFDFLFKPFQAKIVNRERCTHEES